MTIAIDERDPAKIEPFLAAHGAANLPALIDRDRTIDKVAQVSALPTSLLVDRDGKVKAMVTGDACWNCGTALAAVKAFIADGTVSTDELETVRVGSGASLSEHHQQHAQRRRDDPGARHQMMAARVLAQHVAIGIQRQHGASSATSLSENGVRPSSMLQGDDRKR